jgi:Protein of unknown function (DUF4031)
MTVYVDDMYLSPAGKFRRMKMSHMIADTEAELHAMADAIGVARKWHQGDHYDIAMSKRAEAVKLGAVAITWRQCGCMAMLARWGLPMGDPGTSVERVRLARAAGKITIAEALAK